MRIPHCLYSNYRRDGTGKNKRSVQRWWWWWWWWEAEKDLWAPRDGWKLVPYIYDDEDETGKSERRKFKRNHCFVQSVAIYPSNFGERNENGYWIGCNQQLYCPLSLLWAILLPFYRRSVHPSTTKFFVGFFCHENCREFEWRSERVSRVHKTRRWR